MLAQTIVDTRLLEILKERQPGNASFKLALKKYRKLISEERLYFLHNRGSYVGYLCNVNANLMEKRLNNILKEKGVM